MRGLTIAQTMGTINLGLRNARRTPGVKKAIGIYGYDDKRLDQGVAIYREVEGLRGNYDVKYTDAKKMHHSWKTKSKDARGLYMMHLTLTRIALEDCPFLWSKMGMTGRRAYSFDGWTNQAKSLYAGVLGNEDILAKLSPFKITREKLTKGLELVEEAIACRQAHIRLQAEAKQARMEWDRGLTRLKHWYSGFRVVLRIALEKQPALLTAVGIGTKLRSGRSEGQSEGRSEAIQDIKTVHSCEASEKVTGRDEASGEMTEKVTGKKKTDKEKTGNDENVTGKDEAYGERVTEKVTGKKKTDNGKTGNDENVTGKDEAYGERVIERVTGETPEPEVGEKEENEKRERRVGNEVEGVFSIRRFLVRAVPLSFANRRVRSRLRIAQLAHQIRFMKRVPIQPKGKRGRLSQVTNQSV